MSKYRPASGATVSLSVLAATQAIQGVLASQGRDSIISQQSAAMESYTPEVQHEIDSCTHKLNAAMEGLKTVYTPAQREAGDIAKLMAADPINASRTKPAVEQGAVFYADNSGVDAIGLEEYDETSNRNITTHAFVYNLEAARQDEFGEAFYPTVTVAPDEPGYKVEIELVGIFDAVRRDNTGNPDDWPRRNVLFGLRDPDILRTNTTDIIPVHRSASAAKFVAVSGANSIATTTAKQDGQEFQTSFLKFNESINLLSISQTDAILATGASDQNDTLDTSVVLQTLLFSIKVGTDYEVFKVDVNHLPRSVFVNDQQGNQRGMVLNFETKDIQINKNTKTATGATPTVAAAIRTGEWEVRLALDVDGKIGLWSGEIKLKNSPIKISKILAPNGDEYTAAQAATTGHPAKAISDLFVEPALIGYKVQARRQNHGKRQLGRLVDSQKFAEAFEVPLLSPIATQRPPANGTTEDTASAIARLVQTTNVQASNAAVDALFEYSSTLASFVSLVSRGVEGPALRNVARWLVTPVHVQKTLDVTTFTDSLRSQDRAADIRYGLVNVLRDDVWTAYRNSNLSAARNGVNGQGASLPTVLIGGDQVLVNWLMFDGDLRTLGADFKLKIVSSPNKRLTGKLFVTFVDEDQANAGKPYALGFGNMAWKVQVPFVLQTQRNGSTNRELTVQPAFRHVNNLPVLLDYSVINLSTLVNARLGLVAVEV